MWFYFEQKAKREKRLQAMEEKIRKLEQEQEQ